MVRELWKSLLFIVWKRRSPVAVDWQGGLAAFASVEKARRDVYRSASVMVRMGIEAPADGLQRGGKKQPLAINTYQFRLDLTCDARF